VKQPKDFRILIACEESQEVCKAFRARGFEAYSCDLQECSGGHPEWHFNKDVFDVIDMGWDLMIGHPPCTYLSFAGNRWFNIERYGQKAIQRHKLKNEALVFFERLWVADIKHICIENPRGIIQQKIKHHQTIQPYFFGDSCSKTTLLWLKNLPKLIHHKNVDLFCDKKTHVNKGEMCKAGSVELFGFHTLSMTKADKSRLRSKTFAGIANAMAEQWGNYLLQK
jgi:site-specific DNA-cytosine methylase